MENGKENGAEKKPKPKYSIHDYKPKKRYTREEKEKINAVKEFLEALRKSNEKNEQTEETVIG